MRIFTLITTTITAGLVAGCGGGGGSSPSMDPSEGTNTESAPPVPTDANGYVLDDQGVANPWLTVESSPQGMAVGGDDPRVSVNTAAIRSGLLDTDGNRTMAVDGSGKRIAVYDSAFNPDHEQLAKRSGKTERPFSYKTAADGATLSEGGYTHGTAVASVAAGRRGVAPGADLDLYAATIDDASNPQQGTQRISDTSFIADMISRKTDVINYSQGVAGDGPIIAASDVETLRNNSDTVFVKAAGNSARRIIAGERGFTGLTLENLSSQGLNLNQADMARYLANENRDGGQGILVGAANADYTDIASYSDKPGGVRDRATGQTLAAESFITAPGTELPVAVTNTEASDSETLDDLDGTSFAAPMVSGTIALMLERWDQMSSDEVVGLMFRTADRDFAAYQESLDPAVVEDLNNQLDAIRGTNNADITLESDRYGYTLSPVFGHGLLDIEAALAPQGQPRVATGQSVADGGVPLADTGMVTGDAFGNAFADSAALANASFIDAYGRDYQIDLSGFTANMADLGPSMDYGAALGSLAAHRRERTIAPAGSAMQFTFTADQGMDTLGLSREAQPMVDGLSAVMSHDNGLTLGAYQANTGEATPWSAGVLPDDQRLMMDVAGDGYLGDWDQASAVSAGYALGEATALTLTNVYANERVHTGSFGVRDTEAPTANRQQVRLETEVSETALHIGGGAIQQDGRLFGTRTSGAFDFGETATYTASVGASRSIGNANVFAYHERGRSSVEGESNGLIAGFDGLETAKTAFGAMFDRADGGQAGLVYSEPLRVTGGMAALDVPTGVSASGAIERTRFDASVEPDGRERRVEGYVHTPLSFSGMPQASVKLNATLRHEPNHREDADTATFVGAVFEGRF